MRIMSGLSYLCVCADRHGLWAQRSPQLSVQVLERLLGLESDTEKDENTHRSTLCWLANTSTDQPEADMYRQS